MIKEALPIITDYRLPIKKKVVTKKFIFKIKEINLKICKKKFVVKNVSVIGNW